MLPALLGSHPLICIDSTGGLSATGGSGTAAAAPTDVAASVAFSRPPSVAYASKSCCIGANRDQPPPSETTIVGKRTNTENFKRHFMDGSCSSVGAGNCRMPMYVVCEHIHSCDETSSAD